MLPTWSHFPTHNQRQYAHKKLKFQQPNLRSQSPNSTLMLTDYNNEYMYLYSSLHDHCTFSCRNNNMTILEVTPYIITSFSTILPQIITRAVKGQQSSTIIKA